MTPSERERFEVAFGRPVPTVLKTFLEDVSLRKAMPVVYHFSHVGSIFEIQYLSNLEDESNYDIKHKRLVFAVDTDGTDLLVDLSSDACEILQRELGETERIGLTIQDLLEARRTSLRRLS